MEMKEGTSMEMHVKRMKEITDKLAAIGAPNFEEDRVVTLLGSLPPSYLKLVLMTLHLVMFSRPSSTGSRSNVDSLDTQAAHSLMISQTQH